MKLNEIKNDVASIMNEFKIKEFMRRWIQKAMEGHTKTKYEVKFTDGEWKFHIEGNFVIPYGMLSDEFEIPFPIAEVTGTFDVSNLGLKTFKNCPPKVGTFIASKNDFSTLEGCPRITRFASGEFDIHDCKNLLSLEGIADHIDEIYEIFKFSPGLIQRGGLGLVMIKGLETLEFVGSNVNVFSKPFKIISNYLGKPELVFDCQSELIEAGFEEHAKL